MPGLDLALLGEPREAGGAGALGGLDERELTRLRRQATPERATAAYEIAALRRRAAAGRSLRYWVPDAVAEYIAAHRLYEEE